MKNIKKFLFSLLVLVSLFGIVNVRAENYVFADDNVVINSPANHSVFGAGDNVTLNSDIDGITFLAGNVVTVNKEAEYLFAAGNTITVNASVTKDLFVAGNTVIIEGSIGRDAYVAGNSVIIKGTVNGTLFVGGNSVNLTEVTILGDVESGGVNIVLGENTHVTGTFYYEDDSIVTGLDKATVGGAMEREITTKVTDLEYSDKLFTKSRIISEVTSLFINLACSILLFALFPKLYKYLGKKREVEEVGKSALKGLAFLIILPIISVLSMILVVFLPLSIASLFIYVVSIIIGVFLGITYIGNLVLTKLFKAKDNMYLSVLIGSVLYTLLGLIPYVDFIYGTAVVLIGLGLVVELFKKLKESSK